MLGEDTGPVGLAPVLKYSPLSIRAAFGMGQRSPLQQVAAMAGERAAIVISPKWAIYITP